MAIFKALTFDGVNSLDYGIYITGEAAYNAPERAVEMVNIPGKNGALALDQGRFENIEVTYHAGCFADSQADFADKVMKFRNALASRYTYKRLTDEYHPDEYRLGLYKSGLEVDAVRYSTAGEFNITFDCKPQRFLVDGDRAISPTEWSDIQTKSGELVTIDSDGSLAVKALEVSLSPIQDLNGYDKPWVGGAGKNKIDVVNRTESASVVSLSTYTLETCSVVKTGGTYKATSTGPWSKVKFGISGLKENQTYTFSALFSNPSGGRIGMAYFKSGAWTGNTISTAASVRLKITFTYTSDITILGLIVNNTNASTGYEVTMSEIQLEEGSSQTTYEPYENICPISGHTEVTVTDCGKNLLPYPYQDTTKVTNGITFTDNGDGTITANGTATAEAQFLLTASLPNSEWTGKILSGCPQGGSTSTYYITAQVYGFPWTMYARDIGNGVTITDSGYANIRFLISIKSGQTINNLTFKPMICLASDTDATYEPYQGNTYTTALGRTVYGGTLDVVSGELVVTEGYIASYNGESLPSTWISDRDVYASGTIPTTGAQVVYELATSQTYQLTPQQIDLLLGTNHLWSDGEITVEYGVRPYYNPTPFESKPLIKVTGTGTLGIGEYILTITGSASQTLYIDCDTMEIYTIEGTVPTGASSLVSINKNDFPVLKSGTNYISVGSGITDVTITPRWWRI